MQARFEREATALCRGIDLEFSSQATGVYDPPEFDPRAVSEVRGRAIGSATPGGIS